MQTSSYSNMLTNLYSESALFTAATVSALAVTANV
jgi:hypothetical protein